MNANPIDLHLRELSREAKKTTADRMVESMSEVHRRIAINDGYDDDKAPEWGAHLPSGEVIPIHYVGTQGPFIRFTGFGACNGEHDYVLLAPEQVVVTIRSVPTDGEGRRRIGFGDWPPESDDTGESDDAEGDS